MLIVERATDGAHEGATVLLVEAEEGAGEGATGSEVGLDDQILHRGLDGVGESRVGWDEATPVLIEATVGVVGVDNMASGRGQPAGYSLKKVSSEVVA